MPARGGGKRGELQLRGAARAAALASARAWHGEMKPYFDALDAAGAYIDSAARYGGRIRHSRFRLGAIPT